MKIKEQTRKLAAGCSKHCFEVVDKTDEVSSKHCFEVVDKTDEVSSKHSFEVVDRTDEVSNHTYGKATLTWFEFDFRRVLSQIKNSKASALKLLYLLNNHFCHIKSHWLIVYIRVLIIPNNLTVFNKTKRFIKINHFIFIDTIQINHFTP